MAIRFFQSVTVPCPVCEGEPDLSVFARDGSQTKYTVRCPHCIGFGTVLREALSTRMQQAAE